MKKIFTILVGLWLVCSGVLARTVEEAAVIASGFMSQKGTTETVTQRVRMAKNAGVVSPQVSLEYTQATTDNKDAVYVFNHANGGFVWVSASDYSHEVLGYSDSGSFDKNNIPDNMQYWLRMYAGEIARVEAIQPVGAGAKRVAASYQEVAPLLDGVIWDQGAPYNNLCPTIGGQRCVTGCVATATSQIMYKHKHPTYGTGSYSYTTESGVSVSANFDNTFYDWKNMLPSYNNGYTSTQATAVATLMYHVGVASSMNYGTSVSLAYMPDPIIGLIEHFDYDKGILVWLRDYVMDDTRILNAIARDLQAGLPVYMGGATANSEGHAFVCDGMKSDGYLHINWGWGGISNGYFALSALDPELQGTGGSSGNLAFTEYVCVYTGIKPDAGGSAWPMITAEKLTRTSADEIGINDEVSFAVEGIYNQGVCPIRGYLEYYILNSDGEYMNYRTIESIDWPVNEGLSSYTLSAKLPSGLSDGDYELEIVCTSDSHFRSMYVRGEGAARFPFTLSGEKVYFRSSEVNPPSEGAFYCDFEDAAVNSQWQFAQNGQTNYWMIGTGAGDASDGNNALYITNDGVNYQYDSYIGSVSWAYIPVTLTGTEKISFSWKGVAERCCDYLAVYLFPKGYLPRSGDEGVPENAIEVVSSLNEQENWKEVSEVIVAEGDYYLCFRWRNDGSVGNQACAIDDLSIEHMATTTISPLTYLLNDDNTATVMSCDKAYEGEVVIPTTIRYEGRNYTVTAIEKEAFMECALRSVTIPNTVTTIEERAFPYCNALTSVNMGEGVTTMGERAFQSCNALTSVKLSNNLTSIPEYAFYECNNLNSIDFGDGVESIDYYAFAYCYALNTLVIPSQITYIASDVFVWCPLTSIVVETGNRVYDSRNNCNAIVRKEDNTLILGCQNTIIPATVTAIGEGAFYGCTGLTSIDIPNSVTSIGASAFQYCNALTSVKLSNNLTSIEYNAFSSCEALTSIDIPASVTNIGWGAFFYGACRTITMNSATPPTADNAFLGDATIIVPCGAEDAYREVYPWSYHTILGSSAYKLDLASTEGGVARITSNDCANNTYTIEAVSDGRLSFVRWSDGSTDNPRTLTLSADTQLTAEFAVVLHNVTDLVVTTNCGNAFASWESDAPWFEVTVFDTYGNVMLLGITNAKNRVSNANPLADGQYIWQVRPMYSDSYEDYAGDAVQAGFTISGDNCVDLGVYDLAYSIDGFDVTVTWNSGAPLYIVRVHDNYGNLLVSQVINTKSFNFSVSESGYYYFSIYGLSADETQFSELSQLDIYIESDDDPSQGDCYALYVDYTEGGYVELSTYKDCYGEGEYVTLYAYAYEGYEFSHWSTGETDAEITVAMYGDVEIIAYFRSVVVEPACYTLSVTAREGGYVDVYPNKNCYEEGEEVELYATAYEGYVFSHWSDNNTSAERTIVMGSNYQLQAIFVDASSAYDVKNLKLTNSKLNITAKWESIATRFEVTITNKDDEVVNTEVVELQDANKVYTYKVSKYGKYTVTVKPVDADNQPIGEEASKTITLVRKYSLYISSGIGGTVNEEVNGDYAYETSVEIIATAREGYEFFKWSDGNTSAIRTLIMDQDYELVAYFNQKDVAVEDVCADVTVAVEYRTIIVESTQSQDFALYDVVGRLIERQAHTDIANFTVPSAGLYLLRTNNGFVKVRVK